MLLGGLIPSLSNASEVGPILNIPEALERLPSPNQAVVQFGYVVIKTYPHDPRAFTQGLLFREGKLYEGTGRRGQSVLRKIDLGSGRIEKEVRLPKAFFGEGIARIGERIIQLTWKSRTALVWDLRIWKTVDRYQYDTQGWGLTYDGQRLIMSDGSAHLYFRDPATFQMTGRVLVTHNDRPVKYLNELEFIGDFVFANIWHAPQVAIITPQSGRVAGLIDLSNIESHLPIGQCRDVLNGIAYHTDHQSLLVTGKLWPMIFEIGLIPK